MTLLNTLINISGTVPQTFSLWAVDRLELWVERGGGCRLGKIEFKVSLIMFEVNMEGGEFTFLGKVWRGSQTV